MLKTSFVCVLLCTLTACTIVNKAPLSMKDSHMHGLPNTSYVVQPTSVKKKQPTVTITTVHSGGTKTSSVSSKSTNKPKAKQYSTSEQQKKQSVEQAIKQALEAAKPAE